MAAMTEQIPLYILKQYCSSDAATVAKLTDEWLAAKNRADRRAREDAAMSGLFVESTMPKVRPVAPTVQAAGETLAEVKEAHIANIVRTSRTLNEAARRLAINPASLYRNRRNMNRGAKAHG